MLRNRERIDRALIGLTPNLAAFVRRTFEGCYKGAAHAEARRFLDPRSEKRETERPLAHWDVGLLLRLMLRSWGRVSWGRAEEQVVREVRDARVDLCHPSAPRSDFADDETDRILDAIERLHGAISPPPGPKARAMFDDRLAEELLDASWPEATSLLWPAELSASFYTESDGERRFRAVTHVATPDRREPGWSDGISLVVLPADRPHRKADSPAAAFASRVLGGTQYPNSVAFLALCEERVSALRRLVCEWRAWTEVRFGARDILTEEEIDGVSACIEAARRAAEECIREGYGWLLVPRVGPGGIVTFKETALAASRDPVDAAWQELLRAGDVAASLPPARLAEALDLLPSWGRGSHVKISDLPGLFSRDLRFPRPAHSDVIAGSIADGLMDPSWGAFGYAVYHDTARGYAGLYFRGNGSAPGAGLLRSGVGYIVPPSTCIRPLPAAV